MNSLMKSSEEEYKKSEKVSLRKYLQIAQKYAEYLKPVTCPNGITTEDYAMTRNKTNDTDFKVFKFDKAICQQCPLRDQCLYKDKNGKVASKGRRFATMVRNYGLRRCRYVRLGRAKIHITLANMACNIVRMVNLLCQPEFAASLN